MRATSSMGLPRIESMAVKVAVALVAVSVLFALTRESFGHFLLLTPSLVADLMLWQPVTYGLIETTPLGVIFGGLIVVSIGGALEQAWGSRRFVFFLVSVWVLAGFLTVLSGFLLPAVWIRPYAGGYTLTSSLWVAYGLAYSKRVIHFWGVPVSGNVFALIGVAFVFLNGAFNSFWVVVPEAWGMGLTYGYFRLGSPSSWWLRFTSWRLRRKLSRHSRHLRVVDSTRNTPKGSDKYLH